MVNVLKSLVDWEKSVKELRKQIKGSQSTEVEVSTKESVDTNSSDDLHSEFEKAKAHKSTLEAVISEVVSAKCYIYNILFEILFGVAKFV